MRNNLPNFLIVGAAKSGTSSIHNYLQQHPKILMSFPKEPNYFTNKAFELNGLKNIYCGPGDDIAYSYTVKTKEKYKELFKEAGDDMVSGESSTDNLFYHEYVIPLIRSELNQPKIIIILRNPIERAFSAFTHLKRDARETLNFEEALKVEEKRIEAGYKHIWYYRSAGLYYEQVKGYLDNFKNCKVLLFDDLRKDSQSVLDEIFDFLKVSKVKIDVEKTYNKSGERTSPIKSYLYDNFDKESRLKQLLRNVIPASLRNRIREKITEELLEKQLVKTEMKLKVRNELKVFYRADILKLQKLIGQDLSQWLR